MLAMLYLDVAMAFRRKNIKHPSTKSTEHCSEEDTLQLQRGDLSRGDNHVVNAVEGHHAPLQLQHLQTSEGGGDRMGLLQIKVDGAHRRGPQHSAPVREHHSGRGLPRRREFEDVLRNLIGEVAHAGPRRHLASIIDLLPSCGCLGQCRRDPRTGFVHFC